MFILGVLVIAAWIFIMTGMAAHYNMNTVYTIIFNSPTTVSYIIVIAAVILSTGSFKTFVAAINALISKKYTISAADKENSIILFKLLGKSTIYTAVALTMMGFMAILQDMSSPEYIGPNVAVSLTAIFQCACINLMIINPAITVLQSRYNTEEKRVISEKQVIDKLLELCYRQQISPEEILDAKEIHIK